MSMTAPHSSESIRPTPDARVGQAEAPSASPAARPLPAPASAPEPQKRRSRKGAALTAEVALLVLVVAFAFLVSSFVARNAVALAPANLKFPEAQWNEEGKEKAYVKNPKNG